MNQPETTTPFAQPLVSVVVCVRNRPQQIIDCLRALSASTYGNFELVIVDDASTDATPQAIMEFASAHPGCRLNLLRNAVNLGVSGARNVGIAAARGDVILFTDSDCVVESTWIERMVGALQAEHADAVCGAVYDRAPRNLAERAFFGNTTLTRCRWRGRALVGNNMGFRRETLQAFAFDALLNYYCDEDDMARRILASGGHIAFAADAVVEHSHGMNYLGYLKTAYKQGQGSARYWFKHGQYVGRDVCFSVLAILSLPCWLIDIRFAFVTLLCLLLQIAALAMNELLFKGAPLGWSLVVLPLVLMHNLVKAATVLWTLARIVLRIEPLAWQSRRQWRAQRQARGSHWGHATTR